MDYKKMTTKELLYQLETELEKGKKVIGKETEAIEGLENRMLRETAQQKRHLRLIKCNN